MTSSQNFPSPSENSGHGARENVQVPPEGERETILNLLRLMNRNDGLHELIRDVTCLVRNWTGCEAVGIRLREGEDFPYFETRGFPEEHVRLENRLCAVDEEGEMIRDSAGNPVLECMCGNVLCGRFDPSLPFFTESGSFWTGSTSELLASTSEADRQARTRNRCHGEGYESVLLAPVRHGAQTLGLLQLNDSRKHLFTPELVQTVERLASYLGIGLVQREQAQRLRDRERELSAIYSSIPQGALLMDRERRVRSANSAAAAMAGAPAEELRSKQGGEALGCLRHLDDPNGCGFGPECERCAVRNTVLATFRTGESFFQVEADLPVQREGVRQVLTLLISTAFLQIKEKPHVLITLEDISERKRMERALACRERELKRILETIPVQVFYFIDSDTYGTVNQAHADFMGKPKIEIEYNKLEKVLSPELAIACREENKKIFSSGRSRHTYTRLPDWQGRRRLLAVSKTPCTDKAKNTDYLICTCQEIKLHLIPNTN
jgi:PAS domain-containing protein